MTEANPDNRIADYAKLIYRIDTLLESPTHTRTMKGSSLNLDEGSQAKRFRPTLTKVILASSAICVMAALALTRSNDLSVQAPHTLEETRQWDVDGFPLALFNGKSVPLFSKSGSWSPETAEDGSLMLTGQQGAQMTIPMAIPGEPSRSMRLRMGLQVATATTVEIHILHDEPQSEFGVLRFDSDTVQFTENEGTDQPSQVKSIEFPPASSTDMIFRRISLHREGTRVFFTVNGEMVGSIHCGKDARTAIQIRYIRGASSFADIDMVRLAPPVVRQS